MELTAGKVAVVTGAASGIGLALAQRFALNGLDVVLADVEESALGAAAESVERLGVKSLAVRTDVSDEDSVRALAAAAVERFRSVHVVRNNAGVETTADPWFGPVTSWHWVMGVNLWGVIHGIRAFLPILAQQGGGHIVNTASMAGLVPGASPPYEPAIRQRSGPRCRLALRRRTWAAGTPPGCGDRCGTRRRAVWTPRT